MKTVLSPKENRWATVQVYERARVCMCVYAYTNSADDWPASLEAHVHGCVRFG